VKNLTAPTKAHWKNLSFGAYCISTLFIFIFSIEAINDWPPLAKRFSILFASFLPSGMIILRHLPNWLDSKVLPIEIRWILLILLFGLLSSIFSQNQWATLKSAILFISSGPLIFISTKLLLRKEIDREIFLMIASLILLLISSFGLYEYIFSEDILLFSNNSLPASALLLLLSAPPIILLNRKNRSPLKYFYGLSLAFSVGLMILLAKKSLILSIVFISFYFISSKASNKSRLLFLFLVVAGIAISFTPKNISNFNLDSSYSLRAESYFFGIQIFKENPLLGVGLKANFIPYLDGYDPVVTKKLSEGFFYNYFKVNQTFENIVLGFLIEFGGLFTVVYFGGLLYFIFGNPSKNKSLRSQKEFLIITSVFIGFAAMSFTFETLRFPNLNWAFHSLLGLLANISTNQDIDCKI
jgi:O-antigen ligase